MISLNCVRFGLIDSGSSLIDWANSLAPNRRQAISSINDALVYWVLTHICVTWPQWVNICRAVAVPVWLSTWHTWRVYLATLTLENRYGSWPQTGCVTVPGREAAFLVARQRFPYRSRLNFSVKNMENMLLCNAICDTMHIYFSRKIYCGVNDASISFKSMFIKSNESSQNVNVRDVWDILRQ